MGDPAFAKVEAALKDGGVLESSRAQPTRRTLCVSAAPSSSRSARQTRRTPRRSWSELSVSTYTGEGFAIPHGTDASREHINRAALAFLQFPDGVDWDGKTCHVCIPIASRSDEHISILQSLALILSDPEAAAQLRTTHDINEALALLAPQDEEDDE